MKKILLMSLLLLSNCVFALPTTLKLDMSNLPKDNKLVFLCLYGSGCYNLQTSKTGKTFPFNPAVLTNSKNVFIADYRMRKIYSQPISASCKTILADNKTIKQVTIQGKIQPMNDKYNIKNLECKIA